MTELLINLDVPDLEQAVTFYEQATGLRDPFGHGLCLLQWRGRGYDEVAD